MFIVEVIPIARGIFKETLSYFAKSAPTIGSLVSVPVRGKKALALVVATGSAKERKTEIRRGSFALRKLGVLRSAPFLTKEFLSASEKTAEYHIGTLGGVLSTLLPKEILELPRNKKTEKEKPGENGEKDEELQEIKKTEAAQKIGLPIAEKLVFQGRLEDRLMEYKSLVRENFARGKSVFLLFPTVKEAEVLTKELEKGIGRYSFVLHRELKKSEQKKLWHDAIKETHPILVMATGSFLSLPRKDWGLVIVEKESSRFYRSAVRPYLDARRFAETFAAECGAKILLADTVLRVETAERFLSEELLPSSSEGMRLLSSASFSVIDPKTEKAERDRLGIKKPWEPLSEKILAQLRESRTRGERSFVFVGRRGSAPLVVCGDCEKSVVCSRCSAPVVLHGSGSDPYFLCHRCNEKRGAEERCRYCGGWRLIGLGAGSERIEEILKKELPGSSIFTLNKDKTPTDKKAAAVAMAFYDTPGSILIGTEMALFYLLNRVENTVAASFDSLFAIPDFRMHERIFHLLIDVRELATNRFIIQSKVEPGRLFMNVAEGNLADFYREEINMREKLGYPPFRTFIRLSTTGERAATLKVISSLVEKLKDWNPLPLPALFRDQRGRYLAHLLLSIPKTAWPNEQLRQELSALPPSIRVEVDPETAG